MLKNLVLIASIFFVVGCNGEKWQPYFEPDNDKSRGILPSTSFTSLLNCQQYLINRFGNLKGTGTFYCYSGCNMDTPPTNSEHDVFGDIACPKKTKQVVGQL
jgi:hypothetical protein